MIYYMVDKHDYGYVIWWLIRVWILWLIYEIMMHVPKWSIYGIIMSWNDIWWVMLMLCDEILIWDEMWDGTRWMMMMSRVDSWWVIWDHAMGYGMNGW